MPRVLFHCLVLCIGAVVFTGCLGMKSGDEDEFDSDPAFDGADSFYTKAFERYCEGRRTCSPGASSFSSTLTPSTRVFQYPSLAACKKDAANWFENDLVPSDYRLRAVREGRMTFDQDVARRCLRGLNLHKCPFDIQYFSCSDAFEPAVEPGEVCVNSRDCKGDAFCDIAEGSEQCLGTCKEFGQPDPDPDPDPDRDCTDESCPDDQYCEDEWDGSYECQARHQPGETCDPLVDEKDDPSCVDGYFCSYSTDKCEQVVPIGERCGSHYECGVSAFCEDADDRIGSYCTPHKSAGEYCYEEGSDACGPDLPCIDDTCGWTSDFDYCESDRECRPGSRCLMEGFDTGRCVPDDHGEDGDQCDTDRWCQPGLFCGAGTCREGAQSAGQPCLGDRHCDITDNLYCQRNPEADMGVCLKAKRLSLGDPCLDSDGCPENSVCTGTCVELVEFAAGENCSSEPGYCESGTICRPAGPDEWTCRPHAAEDGGCNATFECELGLTCDRETVVCVTPETPEEPDDGSEMQCP